MLQAMQKKVRCGMITASVILSAMFALLAILDMRQEVSYLCVLVFVVTGSLYTYGGKTGIRSLSKGPLETTTTPPKPQPPLSPGPNSTVSLPKSENYALNPKT